MLCVFHEIYFLIDATSNMLVFFSHYTYGISSFIHSIVIVLVNIT